MLIGGEVVVLDPERSSSNRRAVGTKTQTLRLALEVGEPQEERLVVRGAVEDDQRPDGEPERRILSDSPHDRFDRAQLFIAEVFHEPS